MTKELKDLYEEIQKVASFSKASNNNNAEEVSEDTKTLLEDAREDSGLAEMDLWLGYSYFSWKTELQKYRDH